MKTLLLLLFFICSRIDRCESIRCGDRCPFVFLSYNFTLTPQVCPHLVEKKDGQCSAILQLDFAGGGGGGALMMQDRTSPDELRIETEFGLRSNVTMSTLFYSCSSGDNCAFEFARKLFGSALAQFNLLNIQKELRNMLYTASPSPGGVDCANQRCDVNQFCQGRVIETLSPQ